MLQVIMRNAYTPETSESPIPVPGDHQVLIKMIRLGICGSDVQVYHGKHKYMTYPIVQGHEGSGVVVKTGKYVKEFGPGDHVTVRPQVFCGQCRPCRLNHENVCLDLKVYGIHIDGMAAEYFIVDAQKVLKLPKKLPFTYGAMTEPVAVAVGTIRRCGEIKNKNVVILGSGTIGNLVAQVALHSGAGNVIMTDISDKRLKIGKLCGIYNCANTSQTPLADVINNTFGENGADIIIDCAAVPKALLEAIDAARPASQIVIVGNYKEPVTLELPKLQRQQIDMLGIMMYEHRDFISAINIISDGTICLAPLITKHFALTEFSNAYKYIDENPETVMKIMIDVADDCGGEEV